MKHPINNSIVTEIIIDASAQQVWSVLTDLKGYVKWNPFLVSSEGQIKPGARLKNTMRTSNKTMVFKPAVRQVVVNEYFDWLGHLYIPGIFDGHHYFKIESINKSQVKLIHGENFSGILSSFIFRKIGNETRQAFILMNQALKQQAEKNNQ